MGADGHIKLFDMDKFLAQVEAGHKTAKTIIDLLTDSVTYVQTFEGRKILTVYHGDNLYTVSLLEEVVSAEDRREAWEDPSDCDRFFQEVSRSKLDKEEVIRLCHFLWKDCRMAEWEIWT